MDGIWRPEGASQTLRIYSGEGCAETADRASGNRRTASVVIIIRCHVTVKSFFEHFSNSVRGWQTQPHSKTRILDISGVYTLYHTDYDTMNHT